MRKIIGSLVILVGLAALYFINLHSQQSVAKMQNSLNLEFVNQCVKQNFSNLNREVTSVDLTIALNVCAKGLLSNGITGDIFVIRVSDKKLFWDNSTDCKPGDEGRAYMTLGGVCSLFNNSGTCIEAVETMINNEPRGYSTWLFDDAEEYINYRYLYTKISNDKYIIGQGTQSDELESKFYPLYIATGVWSFILVLIFNV